MKVVFLGALPPDQGGENIGGLSIHVAHLADHLTREGIQVTVLATNVTFHDKRTTPQGYDIYPIRSIRSWNTLLRHIKSIGHRLLRGGNNYSELSFRSSVRFQRRLAMLVYSAFFERIIPEICPDVIHLHAKGPRALSLMEVATRNKVPIIMTLHSLKGHYPDWKFYTETLPGLEYADRIITVSQFLSDQAQAYGVPKDIISVIPNGVDTKYFYPIPAHIACDQLRISRKTKIILFVGQLIQHKGVDILIKSVALACKSCPEIHLYIVGGETSETNLKWHKELLQLPGKLGVNDKVTFLGQIRSHHSNELNYWYNAAHLLVLPSREEGLGMVLLEAMACGTPVIGTTAGGIPNVISHNHNGLLVPKEDVNKLAEAIIKLVNNHTLAEDLGASGRQDIVDNYSWIDISQRTIDIYSSTLEKKLSK